jgi:hypothetical protein
MKAHTSQKPLRSTLPSIRFVQTDADKSKPVGELPEQKHELVSRESRQRRVHLRRSQKADPDYRREFWSEWLTGIRSEGRDLGGYYAKNSC